MRRHNLDIYTLIIIVILLGSSMRNGGYSDPREWLISKLLLIPAVIIGLSAHEFAHAFTAWKLGDPTPKYQGRVTMSPIAHIDWLGLAALFFCGFGWGIPVQINPDNFKHRRRGEIIVASAGVIMNLIVAVIFTFVAKALLMGAGTMIQSTVVGNTIFNVVIYIIQINLVLMIFNLIPVPPLDGFNLIANIGNFAQTDLYWKLYRYGSWILVGIIIFGITSLIISPCVNFLYGLLVNLIIY